MTVIVLRHEYKVNEFSSAGRTRHSEHIFPNSIYMAHEKGNEQKLICGMVLFSIPTNDLMMMENIECIVNKTLFIRN